MIERKRDCAFPQSDAECRLELRGKSSRPPEFPGLFANWCGRSRLISDQARKSSGTTTNATTPRKPEPWRITPVLPNRGPAGDTTNVWPTPPTWVELKTYAGNDADTATPLPPRLPAPWEPGLWPTLDRILHPWEAPISPIEYAVTHFLGEKYPEIQGEVIDFALRYTGIIPDDDKTTGENSK